MRKNSNRKYIFMFLFIPLFIILLETIGFSAFKQKLAIDDISSTVRVQSNIRITNLSYADNSPFIHGASTDFEEFNKNNISGRVNLPYFDSSVTYKVKITNIGNVELGILSLNGLPENLSYEVIDYELGKDKLCGVIGGITQCKLGIDDYVNIKIKYKDGMYNSSNTVYNFTLNFDFEYFHPVIISNNIELHISNYPLEVMNNSTLSFNFDNNSNLTIYVSGQEVEYTYNNGIVTVENVDGPVEISGEKAAALTLVTGPELQNIINIVRWFQGSYAKTRIVFTTKDKLPSTAINTANGNGPYGICADEGQTDAIMVYVNNETIYIASEGNRIKFGENVSSMFSGNNIKKTLLEIVIDDGIEIDGSEAKIFDWMFNGVEVLPDEQINNFLKVFEGANPTSLNATFMNLKQVEVLDLSPFRFDNNVQYSSAFFNGTFSGDNKLKTIYVDSSYSLPPSAGIQQGTFSQNQSLVGQNGFSYDSSKVSSLYARIDSPSAEGYFTVK